MFLVMATVQMLLAMVCGGIIGFQRQTYERPAGFRTHILVCLGSTIFMLVSIMAAGGSTDTGRIAAQVASGIGFLGAGTIIKQGSLVRGLTTAASLWAVAGIGLAIGAGGKGMMIAVIGTIMVFLTLTLLRTVEEWIDRTRHAFTLLITIAEPRAHLAWVQETLTQQGIEITTVAFEGEAGAGDEITIEGRTPTPQALAQATTNLMQNAEVRAVCRPNL